MNLPKPVFLSEDSAEIVREMVAAYETETGRTVQPADIERLIINAVAYREQLLRTAINDAARQNLVAYARFPMLDYLGQLVGVTRLAAAPALTTIRFILISGHTGVTIPIGLRVASSDGKVIFATLESVDVAPGTTTVDIECEAQAVGTGGNGFAAASITTILDPQAWLVSASNQTETAGGSSEETDDALRARIMLAPASFSNAGSKGAYEYWARTASPSIIDVAVINPNPGDVDIYPLVAGGIETPAPVLALVEAACNDERIRPLTDLVTVISPTKVNYTITVNVILITGTVEADAVELIEEALQDLADTKLLRMGRDITPAEIIRAAMIDGVYSVSVAAPASIVEIDPTEFGFCTAITVNVTGTNDG
jgi:phage-related baseplate assembly protein